METQTNQPSESPAVKRLIRDKTTRDYQWEIPNCRNGATGEFLKVDIEYWWQSAEPDVGINAGPVIETMTIDGCDVSELIEKYLDDIEAAIIAWHTEE